LFSPQFLSENRCTLFGNCSKNSLKKHKTNPDSLMSDIFKISGQKYQDSGATNIIAFSAAGETHHWHILADIHRNFTKN